MSVFKILDITKLNESLVEMVEYLPHQKLQSL